jgi:hypothetical protein
MFDIGMENDIYIQWAATSFAHVSRKQSMQKYAFWIHTVQRTVLLH